MRFLLSLVAVCLIASGTAMYLMPAVVPDDKLEGMAKWGPVCMYMVALIMGAIFILSGVHILWEMPSE